MLASVVEARAVEIMPSDGSRPMVWVKCGARERDVVLSSNLVYFFADLKEGAKELRREVPKIHRGRNRTAPELLLNSQLPWKKTAN
jgi:hypothetical protein